MTAPRDMCRPASADSSELFPEAAIAAWLDAQNIAPGGEIHHERISEGRSNVMFRVRRGERRLVLRRPAKVAVEKANDGMLREFRVLDALDGTPVPHPGAVALCDDEAVIGCVFYVMDDVPGVNPTTLPPALGAPEVARHDVTLAVTDALASLHEVDWEAVGLGDFGHPDGFHERQVQRWTSQYESYNGRVVPEVATIGAWLAARSPGDWSPTIMHADYHMLNVLIAEDKPARVTAIVDWETATIGDPFLDLAGFTEVWCGAYRGGGWPDRATIVERYAQQRDLVDVPDLRYYEVLYNFRLGVLLEGVYQRSLEDNSREDDELANERATYNLRRAIELIEN